MDTESSQRVVLLSVDEGEHTKYAFQWFIDNVYKPGDKLCICHIPEPPSLPALSFKSGIKLPAEEWSKALQDTISQSEKIQNDFEYLLRNKNIKGSAFVGESNKKIYRGILEAAQSTKADLIVLGTRSLDAMRRTFKGSVSEEVLHNSSIPVLIIPMPSA